MATMNTAIEYVDNILPNVYKEDDKYEWLSKLDGRVAREVLNIDPPAYELPRDADTELLVEHPYDSIYALWLMAMIHFHNQEYDSYNNVVLMFQEQYDAFKEWHQRTHGSGTAKRFRNIMG